MSYRPLQRAAATALLTPALLFPLAARATTDAEIAELRTMIDQIKAQYETRIGELETRLANAERAAARPAPEPAARDPAESRPMTAPSVMGANTGEPPKSAFGSLGSGNAFNPQIAVILNGNYYQDDINGEGATLLGMEALTGDQEVFGATVGDAEQQELNLGETKDGPQLWTAFAKMAPDIGRNHALQFGLSYAHANQQQLVQTHTHANDGHDHSDGLTDHSLADSVVETLHETGLAGDADLWGIDLVYKYDGGGAHGKGDVKFQSEYLRSIKDLDVRASAHGEALGSSRKYTIDGLYAQALYGFAPKWTAGLRYDVLGLTNKVSGGVNESFGASDRWTLDVSWSLSEFSRLRAQYAYNHILVEPNQRERFNAFYLQFLMSLGSHGSHGF